MSPQIKYHSQNNILSVRLSKNKSVDSDIRGNVVIDYDRDGQVVNIEIMDIDIRNFVPVRQMKKLAIEKIRGN